jgi:hypothetical protein
MKKELVREYPPPTISTRIRDSCTGTSEVSIITNTPKKHPEEAERRLDLIYSSMRSHQGEGNSEIIDPIDSASDYLLN